MNAWLALPISVVVLGAVFVAGRVFSRQFASCSRIVFGLITAAVGIATAIPLFYTAKHFGGAFRDNFGLAVIFGQLGGITFSIGKLSRSDKNNELAPARKSNFISHAVVTASLLIACVVVYAFIS
jgi:hypothetical protein